MSILNDRLNNIINNSKIKFYDYDVKNNLRKLNIKLDTSEAIKNIWNNIDGNSRVAIYGAGNHTIKLFETVNKKEKNIVCIVDNLKPSGEFLGYPLIDKEKINEYNIDIVVISTMGYSKEIKEDLLKSSLDIKIIDIAEELEKYGYHSSLAFYNKQSLDTYTSIFEIRNIYEDTKDEIYLSNLIYRYLNARYFIYAYKYINMYINNKHKQSELFKQLRNELDKFLDEINDHIKKSKNRNGLIVLIDSLRWNDVYKSNSMKFIKLISRYGINCNNAYTHVPYTSMSILSMITEKKCLMMI